MSITDEIKKKIKGEHIKPKAKWKFYFVNLAWWFLFVLLFLITSIAFGVVVYMFLGADWEVTRLVSTGLWGRLLLVMPRLWLALIIVTTILAVWEFRKTKKGYRFDVVAILAIVLIGSVLLGSIVYTSGLGARLDSLLSDKTSFYKGRLHQQMDLWDKTDKGLLIGRVFEVNINNIILHAPQGCEWNVNISSAKNREIIRKDVVLKIKGDIISDGYFEAKEIYELEMDRFDGGHRPPMKPFMSPLDGKQRYERFPLRSAY